jgi:TatD DNase family protein
MRYVDSHVHLPHYPNLGELLSFASSQEMMLFSVSTNVKTAEMGLEQRERFQNSVKSFVGIHPSDALVERNPGEIASLVKRADGVGEIGLDPHYSEVSRKSKQMEVFVAQIQSAEDNRKPVQVHTRGAEKTCLETLGSYELPRVLLHWFEGEQLVHQAADRGYYVSVGPALLSSKKIMTIAKSCPTDLLMTESDGPVSFSAIEGVSGPYTVPSVVFRLSQILKKDYFDLLAKLVKNAESFLAPGKG